MNRIFLYLLLCFTALAQTRLNINVGTNPNDGSGDTVRTAFGKANTNFIYLFGYTLTNSAPTATRATFSDAAVVIVSTNRYVAQVGSMTSTRTATLPLANSVSGGTEIIVADESGTVTTVNPISVQRAGADTINGATSVFLETAYGRFGFKSDGTNKWSFDGGVMRVSKNLSDLLSKPTSVDNLGGAAATGTGGLVRINSPTFGTAAFVPTAAPGDNTTKVANTAFVTAAVAAGGGPAAAGTLTGNTLAAGVIHSSLQDVGTLSGLTVTAPIAGSVTGSAGSATGNAATATALQTARTINGTSFDGTANITVPAAAGTLTGATLAAGVTASSLTSVGTIAGLTTSGTVTTDAHTISAGTYSGRALAKLIATATDRSIVLAPSGTGYISVRTPDGTVVGGNNRGSYSVDLTLGTQGSASGVASGTSSFLAGNGGTASGANSICFAAGGGIASGASSICIGSGTASGDYSVALGYSSTASGLESFSIGQANVSSGVSAFTTGQQNTASGPVSQAGGYQCAAPLYGQMALGAGQFAAKGDAQRSALVAHNTTTDATATSLYLDGASALLLIPANTSWLATVTFIARTATATATYASYTRTITVWRGVAVGTTVATTSVTMGTDSGSNAGLPPVGWVVTLAADATNGGLSLKGTGAAATTVRWVASVNLVEVAFP